MIYLLFGGATAYISYYYSNNIKNWITDKSYDMYNYFYPKFIKDNIKVKNIVLLIFDENYDNIVYKQQLNIENSLFEEYNNIINNIINNIKNKNIYKSLDKSNILLLFEYNLSNVEYNPILYRFNYILYDKTNNYNKNIKLTDYIKNKIIYLDNLFNISKNININTNINTNNNTNNNKTNDKDINEKDINEKDINEKDINEKDINEKDINEKDEIEINEDNIIFISQKCDNSRLFKLLSIDYNNSDITDIFKSYSGFNNDYHQSVINFKTILDENYTQIYNGTNNVNIIYNNLDIEEINLKKNDYILNKFIL